MTLAGLLVGSPAGRAPEKTVAAAPERPVAQVANDVLEPAIETPEPTPEPTPQTTAAPTAKPTPRPRPTTAPRPATVARAPLAADASAAELRMLTLINGSRVAGGRAPLTLDAQVSAVARGHSAWQARLGYVYHDGPDGTAASRNVPVCGSGWFGENVGTVRNGNVDALHWYFMSEPWQPINHRTNIMDSNFRRVGIGGVQGGAVLYMTMVFCR
jgi:uncharacterized protein YkwD